MIAEKFYNNDDIIFSSSAATESPQSFSVSVGYGYSIEIPKINECEIGEYSPRNCLAANSNIVISDGGEFASVKIVAAREINVGEVIAAEVSAEDWIGNLFREKKIDHEFIKKFHMAQLRQKIGLPPVIASDDHKQD